jgi:hypothetical protein
MCKRAESTFAPAGKEERDESKMRSLLALMTVALLSLGGGGCGSERSESRLSSGAAVAGRAATSTTPASTAPGARPTGSYLNDGDNDPSNDNDSDDRDDSKIDDDSDYPEDHLNPENDRYHDKDDTSVVAFGSPASTADRLAVTALVKRYYAAGAADDGAKACATMVPSVAQGTPEDYGRAPGPGYLRGANTCKAVMSLLLEHFNSRFAPAFDVTGVRVKGDDAYALLGSKTGPASYIILRRERGGWKVNGLLGGPLP